MGRLALALFAVAAVLIGAAPANAATVSLQFIGRTSDGRGPQRDLYRLTYSAAPGEANRLTLDRAATGPDVRVRDTGAPITPGSGCHPDSTAVVCSPGGEPNQVSENEIDLGDGADTAVVDGSTGHVRGGPGADDLRVQGFGSFELDGGAGADSMRTEFCCSSVTYADRAQGVTVTPNGLADDGAAGEGDDVGPGFATIRGGSGPDVLRADDGTYTTLAGGAGADQLFGGALGDGLYGGEGSDLLSGGDGQDRLEGNAGADVLRGDGGTDVVLYGERTENVTVTLDDAGGDGAEGEGDDVRSDVEDVDTGTGDDTIVGSAAANQLFASIGDDRVDGAAGADRIGGGTGVNHLTGGPGPDDVNAAGPDTIDVQDGERDMITCNWPANGPLHGDAVDLAGGCAPVPVPLGPMRPRATRSGKFDFKLQCPGGVDIPCPGKIVVRTGGQKPVKVGSQRMRFTDGTEIVRYRFRLSSKLRRLLERKRRLHLTATVTGRRELPASTRSYPMPIEVRAPRR